MLGINHVKLVLLAAYVLALGALLAAGSGQPVNPPPFPNNYIGSVFIAGEPAPDGIEIFVRVGDYQSNLPRPGFEEGQVVLVKNGQYRLFVVPPDDSAIGKRITFHATRGFGDVRAEETAVFRNVNLITSEGLNNNLDLNFPEAPPGPPEATPTPTSLPTPTPTVTPVLPIPGDASVPQMSRMALFVGMAVLGAGVAILLLMRRRKTY